MAIQYGAAVLGRKDRLDPAGDISRQQADRAGRGNGKQMTVADAVPSDAVADIRWQCSNEWRLKVPLAIEVRKAALLLGSGDRLPIGGVADRAHRLAGEGERGVIAVAQTQHDQRIRQPGDAKTDPPRLADRNPLLRQRETRDVDYVVQTDAPRSVQ